MKISRGSRGTFLLEVSEVELVTISNCINDAVNLMVEGEFSARVGVGRQQVLRLVDDIVRCLRG